MKTAKSRQLGQENPCQSLVTVTVTRQKRKKHCILSKNILNRAQIDNHDDFTNSLKLLSKII